MVRESRSITYSIAITVPTRILNRNPFRVMYSIQNLDAANFVCVAAHQQVTAPAVGAETHNTGQRIVAGQSVSDTDDKDEVWCVANTGAVNIAVLEVVDPTAGLRNRTRLIPARGLRGTLRHGTRQGP